MSSAVLSGGFPHLYQTNVAGASIDSSAQRSVARADVAELHARMDVADHLEEPEHHLVNIAAKRALSVTEFKQIFYASGNDDFALANVYEYSHLQSSVLSSVWGKRTSFTKLGPGTATEHTISVSAPSSPEDAVGDKIVLTDAHGKSVVFEFIDDESLGATLKAGLGLGDYGPTAAEVYVMVGVSDASSVANLIEAVSFAASGVTGIGTYGIEAEADTTGGVSHVLLRSTVNSGSSSQKITVYSPNGLMVHVSTTMGVLQTPYNASRVVNYNKLGGRPDDPSGVDLAYGYAADLQRNFYAQYEVMGNLEKDLCLKRDCWTLCSRMSIEDQLYGLAFVAETCDDVCMKVSCARKWSEVEDALAESCLAEGNTVGLNDYVDLYVNVRVSNGNAKCKDTVLRIRYPVKITRGPDDLGNWNVVASDAADAVLTTGVPYDSPEGGNLQYANASQTENLPGGVNQQQTQSPDSTAPANMNQQLDPHNIVANM